MDHVRGLGRARGKGKAACTPPSRAALLLRVVGAGFQTTQRLDRKRRGSSCELPFACPLASAAFPALRPERGGGWRPSRGQEPATRVSLPSPTAPTPESRRSGLPYLAAAGLSGLEAHSCLLSLGTPPALEAASSGTFAANLALPTLSPVWCEVPGPFVPGLPSSPAQRRSVPSYLAWPSD